MATRKTAPQDPADLRPHPLNKEIYGRPTDNTAYEDIKAGMKARGFDDRQPLLVTADGRILWGVTRWHIAKALGLGPLPTEVFQPSSPETADLEYERELVRGNVYRVMTQVQLA